MNRELVLLAHQAGRQNHVLLPFYRSMIAIGCLIAPLVTVPTSLIAGETYITAGVSSGPKTLNSYQAIIYAPFGSLSESGLILRGWSKSFGFSYQTDLPGADNAQIKALGLSVEGEAGWQFAFDQARMAVYGGVVWRKYSLTPADPGSTLDKSRIGFSATIDGEYKFSNDYGIMANASYLQGFNQFWVQAKPYVKVGNGWKIGLDAASAGGKDYNNSRIGLFASDYELTFWAGKRIFLGGEAGVQFSFKDNKTTPYAGINIGYLF